ncbi:MAG: AmmeMemoRadiSam system protein B [Dehalococcoidales bacterium]|nr:AmmeMemoRadiSam system protein B [Dehalococcoidales bacterium]
MKRYPSAAGYFYPASPAEIKSMMARFIDKDAPKEEVVGLLMPHAGYQYSGAVAGATLSRIKFKDTFIIIGPTHSGLGKPFSVMPEGTWETPLGEVEVDAELAGKIISLSKYAEADYRAHEDEHAIEVQVPFLQYIKPDVRIVPIILAGVSDNVYKEIGHAIARAIKELKREAVILASGDMTHHEPHETAKRKDMAAVEAMLELDEDELTRRYNGMHITMCAHGPVVTLMAAAKELGVAGAELIKYQTSGETTGDYDAVVGYAGVIFKKSTRKSAMHPIAALAKETVETYVKTGKVPAPPEDLTPEMKAKAGVFVSIHKLGDLRGCIGTFEPQQENVAEEIIANAVNSATRDPRFSPVEESELKDLDYSVDVLTTPEPVDDESKLDAKKYGVIVEAGWRKGLLLPDLEGVNTPAEQIDICRQKGGIGPDETVQLYRFEVKRYK